MSNDIEPKTKNVTLGFKLSAMITRKYAHSFYFASHILPGEEKNAAYAVYAFCRSADESVDDPLSKGALRLDGIKSRLLRAYGDAACDDPALEAFRLTVKKYRIPEEYFRSLIRGMEMDLTTARYRDFNALKEYCYCAAGVIGLIMLKIFGADDKRCREPALNLGIAMQLTNILRDIKEDYARGRIYIPQQELEEYGVTESDIASGRMSPGMNALMRFQIFRARSFYGLSLGSDRLIRGWRVRIAVRMMRALYAGILGRIEENGYDVFARRAALGFWRKTKIALKELIGGQK